jgi:hypothetical protein
VDGYQAVPGAAIEVGGRAARPPVQEPVEESGPRAAEAPEALPGATRSAIPPVLGMYLGFLACAGLALALAFRIPKGLPLGPALIPVMASSAVALLALGGLAGLAVTRRADGDQEWLAVPVGRVAAATVLLVLYTLAVPTVGFVAGTVALVAGLLATGYRRAVPASAAWKDGLGLLALVALLYLAFVYVLQVGLP